MVAFNRRPRIDDLLMENSINDEVMLYDISRESELQAGDVRVRPARNTFVTSGLSFVEGQ